MNILLPPLFSVHATMNSASVMRTRSARAAPTPASYDWSRCAADSRSSQLAVPTIALLAPTLLLFVAAPLPYLLTGWR